ncbi:MAG: hypothetical protein WBW76_12675 [Candidatus Cybelea sp.]
MKSFAVTVRAPSVSLVAVLLTGCGSGSQMPLGARWSSLERVVSPAGLSRAGSWMKSEAKRDDLLYVSDQGMRRVDVFSYPHGKLVGKLYGFVGPAGECVDGAGDVFVVDGGAFEIVEYAHGEKKPIATLSDPGYLAASCSVSPRTGDLAVMNYCSARYGSYCSGPGSVAIYRKAKGSPKSYTDPDFPTLNFPYGGYDDRGDLFADGTYPYGSEGFECGFTELPNGKGRLDTVTLGQYQACSGGVQWDGKYIAIVEGASRSIAIDQFSIRRREGTKVGSTPLSGVFELNQVWIEGGTVLVADYGYDDVKYFNYPAGGSPTKTIAGFQFPYGVTVSRAATR